MPIETACQVDRGGAFRGGDIRRIELPAARAVGGRHPRPRQAPALRSLLSLRRFNPLGASRIRGASAALGPAGSSSRLALRRKRRDSPGFRAGQKRDMGGLGSGFPGRRGAWRGAVCAGAAGAGSYSSRCTERALSVSSAARCSASFLLRPHPEAYSISFITATTSKNFRWSGPSSLFTL